MKKKKRNVLRYGQKALTENIHYKSERGQFMIVGIGEVLWDVLPNGKLPGGAPANFAYISTQLCNRGVIASRLGNDADGKELIEKLNKCGAPTQQIQIDPTFPTGRVEVELKDGIPTYEIKEHAAWDNLELTKDWIELAQTCDAICFGTLAQRSPRARETILAMVKAVPPSSLKIFDVNLRQNYFSKEVLQDSLSLANVLKLNSEELHLICEMFEINRSDETEKLSGLKEKFEIETACVTLGSEGSILVSGESISIVPGVKVKAIDTIGAGDAFTAAMTHGFLHKWEIEETNRFANRVGAYVASQKGAMPKLDLNLLPAY